jgi:hypothetical protein
MDVGSFLAELPVSKIDGVERWEKEATEAQMDRALRA